MCVCVCVCVSVTANHATPGYKAAKERYQQPLCYMDIVDTKDPHMNCKSALTESAQTLTPFMFTVLRLSTVLRQYLL